MPNTKLFKKIVRNSFEFKKSDGEGKVSGVIMFFCYIERHIKGDGFDGIVNTGKLRVKPTRYPISIKTTNLSINYELVTKTNTRSKPCFIF